MRFIFFQCFLSVYTQYLWSISSICPISPMQCFYGLEGSKIYEVAIHTAGLIIGLTYLLSRTVSMLYPIIGQIFASNRGCFTLMPLLGVISYEYLDILYLSRN